MYNFWTSNKIEGTHMPFCIEGAVPVKVILEASIEFASGLAVKRLLLIELFSACLKSEKINVRTVSYRIAYDAPIVIFNSFRISCSCECCHLETPIIEQQNLPIQPCFPTAMRSICGERFSNATIFSFSSSSEVATRRHHAAMTSLQDWGTPLPRKCAGVHRRKSPI